MITIGFEKQIRDAACILRGNVDAAEYKHVVLGLIFLKYISDKFDARTKIHLMQYLETREDDSPVWYGRLRDIEYFKTARILPGGTGIEWAEGQDIAPHELYDVSITP